ncbi:MAG: cation transporter [Anaerolineae bacterium]|nr:cation transporter [Anaerolineae bacterium]
MIATLHRIGLDKFLYVLLVFAPIALIVDLSGGDPVLVFALAGLGLIPLADLIGVGTEELAAHIGPRFGGLLNATLGNAAELIITIFAISAGLLDLVRASITGSIIGNLLLVMGLSLLLGGLKNGIQTFDRRQAAVNATLLVLAVFALAIPSLFSAEIENAVTDGAPAQVEEAGSAGESEAASEAAGLTPGVALTAELGLSEGVAVVMIVLYALTIVYSFTSGRGLAREAAAHTARWSVRHALIVLLAATLGTVFMSEVLVGAVEHVTEALGLSEFFIGIIIIPLIGNVAEHLVAVQVALKNRIELSLAVSLGSSIQIALFVAPLLVFISLLFNQTLLLIFNAFELIALFSASVVAAFIALDGESNWLEGAMLLAVYLIVAVAFFFLPAGV